MRQLRFPILAMLVLAFFGLNAGQMQAQPGSPYNYTLKYDDVFEAMVGIQSGSFALLKNSTNQSVTLTAYLNGDPQFQSFWFDPMGQPLDTLVITLAPGMDYPLFIGFLATTAGSFTTVLTVTDGTLTDQAPIVATVTQLPGNFMVSPAFGDPEIIQPGMQWNLMAFVLNMTDSTLNMTASLSGDPEFTFNGPTSFQINKFDDEVVDIGFLSSTKGNYSATLYISDGASTDTIPVNVKVDDFMWPNMSFKIEGPGMPGGPVGIEPFLIFELPDSTVKSVTVTNISGGTLDFKTAFDITQDFTVSSSSFTLADGAAKVLDVTYTGALNQMSDDVMWVHGSDDNFVSVESQPVFMFTMPATTTVQGGLDVPYLVDFGIVDTNTTKCEDILIKNTTSTAVTISNIALSGFSTDYSISNAASFSIPANGQQVITVCFTASAVPYEQFEVLTFDYDNPGLSPQAGTIWVDLVGRSNMTIKCPLPSSCIAGWFEDLPITSIGTDIDFTVNLVNFSDSSITVNAATIDHWTAGQNAFSLKTSLPVTVSVFDPAVPGSGEMDLTFNYAPSSPGSISGKEDIAVVSLDLNRTSCGQIELLMFGIPEDSITNGVRINPLFPTQGTTAAVSVQANTEIVIEKVTFYNNLNTPVTVTGLELGKGSNFEIVKVYNGEFPFTLAPDEDLDISLELDAPSGDIYKDKLIVHSSHEHLNKEFPLFGKGLGVTGIDDMPTIADHVQLALAPNPTNGPVMATLSGASSALYQVVDVMGRLITEYQGAAKWQWNANDANGLSVQPGTYYIRATGVQTNGTPFSVVQQAVILE
jgi:hypothetical protein